MAQNKTNRQSVADYHKQIKDMKIRFVRQNDELGIPDYSEYIKKQAEMLGKTANEYIVDLIENDIRLNPEGLKIEDFTIIRNTKAAPKPLKEQ